MYNVPHTIPQDLDILVAGFSCIDFSNLNNKKKTFADDGQSAQTFFGILAYANRFRPRIIVLENIQNCPWPIVKKELKKINYRSIHTLVDSKDYYLPQTRKRGYLVAFDVRHPYFDAEDRTLLELDSANPELDGPEQTSTVKGKAKAKKNIGGTANNPLPETKSENLLRLWHEFMKDRLQRPASSPFFSFILPDGDPKLLLTKSRLSHDGSQSTGTRYSQWIACRGRYQGERLEKGLGWQRPQTKWQSNGTCNVRDPTWVNWAKRQGERVLDTLDIAFLRKLKIEGIDINYKP